MEKNYQLLRLHVLRFFMFHKFQFLIETLTTIRTIKFTLRHNRRHSGRRRNIKVYVLILMINFAMSFQKL